MATQPSSRDQSSAPTPINLRPVFLTLTFACPLLALLPPRKLDFYTFTLLSTASVSTFQLRPQSLRSTSSITPDKMMAQSGSTSHPLSASSASPPSQDYTRRMSENKRLGESQEALKEGQEEQEGGVLALGKKLWYGSEGPGWAERQAREEKEALEEGEGYGELIASRIREVFGGPVEREEVEEFRRKREEERRKEGDR